MAATQKFSNSKLISYTKLSPNHSGLRTMNIDCVSIHTMAGNLSIETCGALFADRKRSASSHYGIGSDGRIALYVEEKNRPWTTSSAAVDQRAVTIEVASKSNKEPYDVTDAAWDALIDLCTDICQRNDIKELKWLNDKGKALKVDVQNMVPHRWYNTKKSCPGTFLFDHYGDIAKKVNSNLKAKEPSIRDTTVSALSSKNEQKIWDFLMGKLNNEYAVAGIMGNLFALSSFVPNNLKAPDEKRLGMDDSTYTQKVNSGEYKDFVNDGAGYGLAMWANKGKKKKLLNGAQIRNKGIGNLNVQLDFLYNDMLEVEGLVKKLSNAENIKKPTRLFLTEYKGQELNEDVLEKRVGYAKEIYSRHSKA